MNDSTFESPEAAIAWENYWSGVIEAGAYSAGGVSHPAIQSFWKQFFFEAAQAYNTPAILDIASGDGALIDLALLAFGVEGAEISSIDLSEAAVESIRERFPTVQGQAADAGDVPHESGHFDVISSQFGVEYAGEKAVSEAARLLAPGGRLALLMHKQGSCIHYECAANLDAIQRVQTSGYMTKALDMFRAAYAALGGAERQPYDDAAAELAPAVQELEGIMREYGKNVAGDTVLSLYGGVADIHERLQAFDPEEVLGWLQRLDSEMETFAGRMKSMIESAMDQEAFEKACGILRGAGCEVDQAGPLLAPGEDLPYAWVITASRPAMNEQQVTP